MNSDIGGTLIIFSALILITLQAAPACLLILAHSLLGKHSPKLISPILDTFISGVGTVIAFLLFLFSFMIYLFPVSKVSLFIISAIITVLAFSFYFFYYRNRRDTSLWFSRSLSNNIEKSTRMCRDTRSKRHQIAFLLGLLAGLCELPFSAAPLLVAAIGINSFSKDFNLIIAVCWIVLIILPLIIFKKLILNHYNLAEIQRWRVGIKRIQKTVTTISFLVIAIIIFTLGINLP